MAKEPTQPRRPTERTRQLLRAWHDADENVGRLERRHEAETSAATDAFWRAEKDLVWHLLNDLQVPLDHEHTGIESGVVVDGEFLFVSHIGGNGEHKFRFRLGTHNVRGVLAEGPDGA
jgi:hypothetical protein